MTTDTMESKWLGHLSTFITSMANFSVQYNFSSIAITLIIMSQSQCTSDDGNCGDGEQAAWVEGASEAGIFVGAVCGEIGFGYLGDYLGRSQAMIVAMSMALLGTLVSAFFSFGSPTAVYSTIITFRFISGIGLGGMFPLSATKAAEDAAKSAGRVNSKASSWSFFWQIPALLLPYILGIAVSESSLPKASQWRLVLGFGIVPCSFTLAALFLERHWLAMQHLSAPKESGHDVERPTTATAGMVIPSGTGHSELSFKQIAELLRTQPLLRKKLLATGGSWFLYDIIVYGLGLLSTYTISAIDNDDGNISSSKSVSLICKQQLIALASVIPATMLSIQLVPLLGLKNLQILGFTVQGICCLLVASSFTSLSHSNPQALFGLYCLVYASLNFGSGITTFSMPAALFPKEIRTTFNGLAAAMGKLGAVVSTFSFYLIAESAGFTTLLSMCTVVAFLGAIFTYFIIDTREILNEEDAAAAQSTQLRASLLGWSPKQRQSSMNSSRSSIQLKSVDASFSSSSSQSTTAAAQAVPPSKYASGNGATSDTLESEVEARKGNSTRGSLSSSRKSLGVNGNSGSMQGSLSSPYRLSEVSFHTGGDSRADSQASGQEVSSIHNVLHSLEE